MKKYYFLSVLLACTSVFGDIVPIGELHDNNSSGVLISPVPEDSSITVKGVATVSYNVLSSSYLNAYIEDSTGGVMIYKKDQDVTPFYAGDTLIVKGSLTQYNGLTEIIVESIEEIMTGHGEVVPKIVKCSEVANCFKEDGSEPLEGSLIRLEEVNLSGAWPSNVELTDSTGSCAVYVRYDSDVDEMDVPPGKYSITGILSQYDQTIPYVSGYQVIPRIPNDIEPVSITSFEKPEIINITESSFEVMVRLSSSAAAYCKVVETGEVFHGEEQALEHDLVISGLNPSTIYTIEYGVWEDGSAEAIGTVFGVTKDEENNENAFSVFFNRSVDTSLKVIDTARGNENFSKNISSYIEKAVSSLDLCIYSFSAQSIATSIIAAYERGVDTRVVYMDRNDQKGIEMLKDAGVKVIDNGFAGNDGSKSMHNKFIIIDYKDEDPLNDYVMTGSANFTIEGLYSNAQNIVWIQSKALAAVYTKEFEEMWGGPDSDPNSNASKFGANKTDNTPHRLNINGIQVEQFMGPSDNIIEAVRDALETADHSVYLSLFAFTHYKILNLLEDLTNKNPDIRISGVFDEDMKDNSVYLNMIGQGTSPWSNPADVLLDKEPGLLHHKYVIVDPEYPESDPLVLTGSANWSYNTQNYNDENTLIIHDYNTANQYLQEFAARYETAGGSLPIVEIDEGLANTAKTVVTVFPQPANNELVFMLKGPKRNEIKKMEVFDLLGRKVLTRPWTLNSHLLKLDTRNLNLGSGMYFYRMTGDANDFTGKFIILK